jgi:hypothetical protein
VHVNVLSVYINAILRGNPEFIKTILKHRLNSPYHGYFLFTFLPIGRDDQNGGMIGYSRREGLVAILEGGVAMVKSAQLASSTGDVWIKLRSPFPQISFINVPR